MKYKIIVPILILFIVLLSISAISATNFNDTCTISGGGNSNNGILSQFEENNLNDFSYDKLSENAENDNLKDVNIEGESFSDISNAIRNADSGDTIYLNGRYYEGRHAPIIVEKDIVIDGSSISDNNLKSVLDAENSQVFNVFNQSNLVLKNLIIKDWGTNGASISRGDVVNIDSCSSLSIINCAFENSTTLSSSTAWGSLIYSRYSLNLNIINLTVSNMLLNSNNYTYGMINTGKGSNINIDGLKFIKNRYYAVNYFYGMIVLLENSKATVKNIELINNTFTSNYLYGGAFYLNNNANTTIENITLLNNNYMSSRSYGGAFYLTNDGNLTVKNIKTQENTFQNAYLFGGFLYSSGKSTLIFNNFNSTKNIYSVTYIYGCQLCLYQLPYNTVIFNNFTSYGDEIFNNYYLYGGQLYVGNLNSVYLNNFNVINVTAKSNNLIYGGVAYFGANSTVKVKDYNFTDNVFNSNSDIYGSSFYGISNNIELNNSYVFNNKISAGRLTYAIGFTLVAAGSNLTVNNLTFLKNSIRCNESVGAIFVFGGRGNFNMTNVNSMNNYFNNSYSVQASAGVYVGSFTTAYVKDYHYENNVLDCINVSSGISLSIGDSNATLLDSTFISNVINSNRTKAGSLVSIRGNLQYVENISVMKNRVYWNAPISDDPNDTTLAFAQGLVVLGEGQSLLYNSKFIDNYQSTSLGIALQLQPNSALASIIDSCEFDKNIGGSSSLDDARINFQDHGGAVCIAEQYNGHAIIRNSNFTNNINSQGGAITPHNNCIIDNCRFLNNMATKFYGGAISTNLGKEHINANITIQNSYFENNSAPIGGAIQARGDYIKIIGCYFIDNDAVKGGAVFIEGNTTQIHNSTFIDNNATHSLSSKILTGQDFLDLPNADKIGGEWDAFGGAVYIFGDRGLLKNNTFKYNSAIHARDGLMEGKGGAIYIYGIKNTILDSYFDDNFAHSGNGSAVYIYGGEANFTNSQFYNHDSSRGTVFIRGNNAVIYLCIFENNTASRGGGAIYSIGNHSLVNMSLFNNNNATIHGGAIHTHGDYIRILESNFTFNNAHPSIEDTDQGLGGAIYTRGDYNDIAYCDFSYNTARNGSAIYSRGINLTIEDDDFNENQAWSYLLITVANPEFSYYSPTNKVIVNITHIGGDNIINAIYNDGAPENIIFYNVTYEHSTVPGDVLNTGFEKIHPVDGVENSQDAKLLYQDSREDLQKIKVVISKIGESDGLLGASRYNTGDILIDDTYLTGHWGNVTFEFVGLNPGIYAVSAQHPEDWLYTQIENVTRFEIVPQVDLEVTKKSDKNYYQVGEIATYTITVNSLGDDATNVILHEVLPEELEIVSVNVSKGEFNSNKWYIGDLNSKDSVTLTLKVKLTKSGEFTNTVNVTCYQTDINLTNNVANKTINVTEPSNNTVSINNNTNNTISNNNKTDVDEIPDEDSTEDDEDLKNHLNTTSDNKTLDNIVSSNATGNPILFVILAFIAIVEVSFRRKN